MIGNAVSFNPTRSPTSVKDSQSAGSGFTGSWSWNDAINDISSENLSNFASESDSFRPISDKNVINQPSRRPTTSSTTTSTSTTTIKPETTTKLLSDWYQNLFADLLAANSKPRRTTTRSSTTPQPLVTAEAEIEIFIDNKADENEDHHEHHEHHDAEHFDQIAKTKKSIPRAPFGNLGLSVTNSGLDEAARNFVDVNNEVGLRLYRFVCQ